MFDESSLSPRSALDVVPARSGATSRRPSREEAFHGGVGGLSSLSEARGREDVGDGRAPLGRMTSTHSLRTAWKLKYQDFIPERPKGLSDSGEPFA